MTDTVNDLAQLNTAIVRVSKEVLISLLWKICEENPSAREFVKDNLFVDENEVPQPGSPRESYDSGDSDASDDDDNEKENTNSVPATTTGPKRLRTRYARCTNCKEEFDVSENTKKSCSYHPAYPEPDYDMWPDHDENCHGPIDTEENRRDYPGSFIYPCCDRDGEEQPCTIDWHREPEPEDERFKRLRYI